jgi:archaellum component FlaG (FlaF/FlaG flagellin family)
LALLESEPGVFETVENVGESALITEDRLVTVFEDGEVRKEYDLDSIRQRAEVLVGTP